MDCQHSCTSPLPRIWVIETLAHSNQVDTSLLLDLLEKTPEISDDFGNNARESVSLRILESFVVQDGPANPLSSASSQKIRLNPSDRCEDVLRLILTEMPPSHPKRAGPEIMKWDLQPFIEHKRSTLAKSALQQLKDAILTGSHSFLASLKGQSGLPVGNQPEREAQVNDVNCNGMKQRFEGCHTNDGHLLHRDLADENLVPVNRKRKATSENAGGNSCQDHILSENGCETHIISVKKYKHDSICIDQHVGGRLASAGIDTQVADMSTVCLQDQGGERCSLGRKTHVEGMALDGPPEGDDNRGISSNGLVGTDEVLPCEKQIPHSDSELNNHSVGKQEQDNDNKEATGDKEGICDSKKTNKDVDKVQNTQRNILDVGEVEDISSDSDGKNDDRTAIAIKNNASPDRQCAYSHGSLATTNLRDQNLSSDTCKRDKEEGSGSLGKETIIEVDGQNLPPGDGHIECISSKGLVGHDEVLAQQNHAACCDTEVPNENFEPSPDPDGENAEGDKNGSLGLTTANEDMDKFEQNALLRNVQNVDEALEDVNISSDSDGYYDERSNIDTKKRTFLSSQCTYSQDSLATTDWRELNLCMKCNKGGKLLVCSSNSCPLVMHESCLGSDATFDTEGKFYCPFCAYSRAISKYMEIKKKVSLARKDFATFICLGIPKESKEPSYRSCRIKRNHLDDDSPESNELNKGDVEKVSNCKRRKKLEYEQAGPSEHPGNSPPFGGKAVDSTNRIAQTLSKDKQGGKMTRQASQSPRVHGRNQRLALAIRKSRGEHTSFQASRKREVSEKQKHVNTRSKKGIHCPVETDLPHENKSPPSPQSTDSEEIPEEENEDSSVSKYFIRVRKPEKQHSYPAIPQLRRKRLPWTSAEEERLKEGMRLYCSPHDKIIPWKKILDFGANVFEQSRTTMDLKDKWRNMCKATPKSK
ncbi:hypothetical protein Salat_1542100 [Sesamum alatum]|uniref:Myb-like domain-containing protein n=1 Tax=Sesamum alatum TaxID=300844 RepID=A0AAE2CMK4_9LAMI|nr:hypothetical protein Salat_1542100 [Sesamum alatum]